ncbi:MAG: ABC transporter ATP-binding protein [Myxococcales bacterium]
MTTATRDEQTAPEAARAAEAAEAAALDRPRDERKRVLEEFHYEQEFSQSYDLRLLKRLWPYMRPHATLLFGALLLIPVTSGATLVQPYLVKRAVDAVIMKQGEGVWTQMVVFYAGAVLLEFVFRFAQVYAMQLAGQRAMVDVRRSAFRHAQRMRVRFFDKTPVGRVLTRVTNDVDSLGELFSSGAVMAVADIVMLLGIVSFMLALDWRLSLVAFAAMPPLAIIVEVVRRFARTAYRDIRARVAQLNAYLSEQVQGMQVVQAFGREERSAEEYAIINDAYRRANYRSIKFDAILYSVVETISSVCVALVLWYAAVRVGAVSNEAAAAAYIGTVVAFYQYIQQFFVPIRDLSTKYTIIQSSLASAERVFGFLDTDDLEPDPERTPAKGQGQPGAEPDPQQGIEFRDVRFGYRPGEEVLHGVSFRVAHGEKVAIVGATGAGKTSTISLLLRLYDIQGGSIHVAGRDTSELSLHQLRRMFALVPQDVFLFTGTVAENVALSEEPDEQRVEACLQRVGAMELLAGRSGGIHARVEERGANFSAGERQLIAFARALYRDAPFLILDEATANIDSETEARLQSAVEELTRDRTSLVIAHRLSTIRAADAILVFHKGRIVEQGNHEELLARGQVYARLYRLQFGEA